MILKKGSVREWLPITGTSHIALIDSAEARDDHGVFSQPARVEFTRGLHTPGIVWSEQVRAVTVPLEASLIHLDWAVHSYDDRRRKVERYDAHTANAGTKWRSYYLYEEEPFAPATFSELPWPEFRPTAFEISQRFPELCLEV